MPEVADVRELVSTVDWNLVLALMAMFIYGAVFGVVADRLFLFRKSRKASQAERKHLADSPS